MSENTSTGACMPNPAPAIRRSLTPSPSLTGKEAAGWWAKAGSVSSWRFGSATQAWMPERPPPAARICGEVRSECAMPLPAVIQLTSPGRIGCSEPRLSRCRISPSKR